jgi:hypothetical protein
VKHVIYNGRSWPSSEGTEGVVAKSEPAIAIFGFKKSGRNPRKKILKNIKKQAGGPV